MSLEKMFLHDKTVQIILKILETEERGEVAYPLNISKMVGSPYSYISKVLTEFENHALIESEFRGRVRVIKLTEDGRRVAEMLKELKDILSKDFVARKRLSLLKSIIQSANGNEKDEMIEILLPVKAELKKLDESRDNEVREEVGKLIKEIEGMLR